jgi:hypothetical protein
MKKLKFAHLSFPQTQCIHFINGEQRVVRGIIWVESGKWTHLVTEGADHKESEVIVNPDNVLFIQVFVEDQDENKL